MISYELLRFDGYSCNTSLHAHHAVKYHFGKYWHSLFVELLPLEAQKVNSKKYSEIHAVKWNEASQLKGKFAY